MGEDIKVSFKKVYKRLNAIGLSSYMGAILYEFTAPDSHYPEYITNPRRLEVKKWLGDGYWLVKYDDEDSLRLIWMQQKRCSRFINERDYGWVTSPENLITKS